MIYWMWWFALCDRAIFGQIGGSCGIWFIDHDSWWPPILRNFGLLREICRLSAFTNTYISYAILEVWYFPFLTTYGTLRSKRSFETWTKMVESNSNSNPSPVNQFAIAFQRIIRNSYYESKTRILSCVIHKTMFCTKSFILIIHFR